MTNRHALLYLLASAAILALYLLDWALRGWHLAR